VNLPILYLGDTNLQTAAAYLAGLIHIRGWPFDYVPSDCSASDELLDSPRSLYILSDYPAARFERRTTAADAGICAPWSRSCDDRWLGIVPRRRGRLGSSPVAEALPVEISSRDDRVHFDQPALLRCWTNIRYSMACLGRLAHRESVD
jgi:hypothetical protein